MKVGSERQAATSPDGPSYAVREIGYTTIANLSAGTLQIWPCYREDYSRKIPYTTVGFLWKSYSDWSSKQIWTTNRSVYIMFFMDLVVFAAQILAFATCFSYILRVGAVQANTFCADVWNSHEKTNNLKFKEAGFSAKSRFPRFCTPSPQIWDPNRRFAALAKRNRQKTTNLQPWPSEIVPKPFRNRPKTIDLFWKKNIKYVILFSKSMIDCVLEK